MARRKVVNPGGSFLVSKQDLKVLNKMAIKAKYKNWRDLVEHLNSKSRVVSCFIDGMEKATYLSRLATNEQWVAALEKYCKKNHQRHTVDLADDVWNFTKGYNKAHDDLLVWARGCADGKSRIQN